jgi:hypothetical protein
MPSNLSDKDRETAQNLILETAKMVEKDASGLMSQDEFEKKFNEIAGKSGFSYREKGYDKFYNLLNEFRFINVERQYADDGVHFKPYVRIIPGYSLRMWAYLGYYPDVLNKLKTMALPEQWYYGTKEPKDGWYPILDSYLRYTFYYLQKIKKVRETDQYALFNTGLVNKNYYDIYALFDKNKAQGPQNWHFKDFCVEGEGQVSQILTQNFKKDRTGNYGERPHYFNKWEDTSYSSKGKPFPDLFWDHILIGNYNRLPKEFQDKYYPANMKEVLNEERKNSRGDELFKRMREFIDKQKDYSYEECKAKLKDSVERAIKQTDLNFRTVLPMYYPQDDLISLLFPLSLGGNPDEPEPDVGLVVRKEEPSGNYFGVTILTLDMAYSNARLVARPESYWLRADKIQSLSSEL